MPILSLKTFVIASTREVIQKRPSMTLMREVQ